MTDPILAELERLIRTDPARRGLISTEPEFGPLLPGHLGLAAQDLANRATSVEIVTGFFIPAANPPSAETDGPPGAVLLAETLRQLGVEVTIRTDELAGNAVLSAARKLPFLTDLPESVKISSPIECRQTPKSHQKSCLSHLISIERVGPSHSLKSLQRLHPDQPEVLARFAQLVSETDRNHCFNMRGICIDEWTAPLHTLFDPASPAVKTIGIGDGGNEIGMGSIPWTELVRRLPEPHGGKIACRVPCNWTIVAGVSNWGAYALAAAVAHLRGRVDILEPWTSEHHFEWLETIVRDGPAVDGVTRLQQPTVDGLPFATYIQPWDAMRQLLGLKR